MLAFTGQNENPLLFRKELDVRKVELSRTKKGDLLVALNLKNQVIQLYLSGAGGEFFVDTFG